MSRRQKKLGRVTVTVYGLLILPPHAWMNVFKESSPKVTKAGYLFTTSSFFELFPDLDASWVQTEKRNVSGSSRIRPVGLLVYSAQPEGMKGICSPRTCQEQITCSSHSPMDALTVSMEGCCQSCRRQLVNCLLWQLSEVSVAVSEIVPSPVRLLWGQSQHMQDKTWQKRIADMLDQCVHWFVLTEAN